MIRFLSLVRYLIPDRVSWFLAHRLFRWLFYRHMRKSLGAFFRVIDPGPSQPKEVSLKTYALDMADLEPKLNPNNYFARTYNQLNGFLRVLERHSFNLRTIGAIFELGCGGARLLRHFRCMEGVRLVGSDLDAENIAWCKHHIPGIEFYVNELCPPLTFAEDESFDLIIAASVFTHIPLDLQTIWLAEMRRVLRPGGIFLCTIVGTFHIGAQLDTTALEELQQVGHVTLDAKHPRASLSTQVIGSWDVFQTRAEVIKVFGTLFHMLDYVPKTLDLLVLQKPRARCNSYTKNY